MPQGHLRDPSQIRAFLQVLILNWYGPGRFCRMRYQLGSAWGTAIANRIFFPLMWCCLEGSVCLSLQKGNPQIRQSRPRGLAALHMSPANAADATGLRLPRSADLIRRKKGGPLQDDGTFTSGFKVRIPLPEVVPGLG